MAETQKRHKGLKIAGWIIGVLLLLVVALPMSLYIPWVQNVVKDYVCRYASEKTGMDISIGRVLVKFPLDVSLDDLLVVDKGDTLVQAGNFTASVAFKPLLEKRVEIDEATLERGRYGMTTDDGSMRLRVDADNTTVTGINVDLTNNAVKLDDVGLRGGKVDLSYLPYKAVSDSDTTRSEPWRVQARRITLDNVDYRMDMLPTIDNMTAHIGHAELHNGKVDTGLQTVDVGRLSIDSADVAYIYPPQKWAEQFGRDHPSVDTIPKPPSPTDSIPWTVRADTLQLHNGNVTYALRERQPARGLDTDHIALSDINFQVKDFYNRGTDVVATLDSLSARERSGLEVRQGSGKVRMDDLGITLNDMHVATSMSDLRLDGYIDQAMLEGLPEGKMSVTTDSRIAVQEIAMAMPSLAETLKDIPQSSPIAIKGKMAGNTNQVDLQSLTLEMPRYARATVSGRVTNPTDPGRLAGDLKVDARFDNINWVKPTLLDKATAADVNLPPMDLKGNIHFAGNDISGDAVMHTGGGTLVGRGSFNSNSQRYNVDANFTDFPVRAILPRSGADNLTAHIRAKGNGFDFLKPSTNVNAEVDLAHLNYNNALYRNLRAHVNLNGGALDAHLGSANPNCDLDLDLSGNISGRHYQIQADGRINDLDLQALGIVKETCRGKGLISGTADINLDTKEYIADIDLDDLTWNYDGNTIVAEHSGATLNADANHVAATFDNEDNHIDFTAPCSVDSLIDRFTRVGDIALEQIRKRSLNIDTLQHTLPEFNMNIEMGKDGIVQRYLQNHDIDFRSIQAKVRNDSNVYIDATAHGITYGTTNIDTLTLQATEYKEYLAFRAHMGNRRGTWDDMAQVTIEGGAIGSTVDFLATQQNIKGQTGYRLGMNATLTDTVINTRLFPENPIIGYREWSMNKDNFLVFNPRTRMLDADLHLTGGESKIALTTKRAPGASNETLTLDVNNLKIEEWTQFLPSLPPMTGTLNADLDIDFDGKNVEGKALMGIQNFTYDGQRQGNVDLNAHYNVDPETSSTNVNADLLFDGNKVAIAYGSLNDSTATNPLNLTLDLNRFPLRKASPFIPGRMIRLNGYANGNIAVTGSIENPRMTGFIVGDSAHITLPRYGATLAMADDTIRIADNLLRLDNYRLYGVNENPVNVNGTLNMRDIANPSIDLRLRGENVQIIGSEQRGFSEAFGKGFVDIDATVKSAAGNMNINADLRVLPTTNVTYVIKDETALTTAKIDENMVTFVDLKDSTGFSPTLITAAATQATNIRVNIDVEDGTHLNVYLSEDGKDRVTTTGAGRLKYTIDFAGKDNLSGDFTIESGQVRYTPPLMAQKEFDINSGSSIVWAGDMLNPRLNLTGTSRMKTTVTGSDQKNHPAEFLITADVGGTLKNIDLKFDMTAEGDMSIQNELQSMSDVQRSQAAINLLLYNTYSGTNSAGNVSGVTATSALFSFLQSQINSWAAKAIKGVDLSFGINQYEGSRKGGIETSYSYRLSKALFNDRFKIAIGGEYSTDATAEQNFAQNLINDISFEYLLNDAGNKYVRLFRHTGFESLLEGKVVQTGVGFVMKRKVSSLRNLFGRSPKAAVPDTMPDSAAVRRDPIVIEAVEPDTLPIDTLDNHSK